MKAAVIVFPGSNCDRDMAVALELVTGQKTQMIWHGDSSLPDDIDLIAVPGGFSYGDYLRSGAMAANSPIMNAIKAKADAGVAILGVCNGFQVLTEAGLLPGVLMRNRDQKFICRDVHLEVTTANSPFTGNMQKGDIVRCPVAHHDGNYFADADVLNMLEQEDRIAFRYADEDGVIDDTTNVNGSQRNIAGILSENRRVLGMMPHPERLCEDAHGGLDGKALFDSVLEALA